jgi:acyl-CoA synthetase (AMP-forming)/AMP-acid ligase II
MTTNAATMMELLAAGADDATALIHGGGENTAPREVDEVRTDHASALQGVTFAVPHDGLGEVVAGVVVLHDGAGATAAELRDVAATRLADCKVPTNVIFRPEIPKGATGKLQRIGLALKLGPAWECLL